MEQKKYSGYYCNKCNYIPLIKIIQTNNEVKVYSSCKCKKQYTNIESFLKKKYRKDVVYLDKIIKESPNNSHNQLNFEESKLELIIKKFNERKKKIIKEGINIRNQLIDIFKRKIEEVNQIYNKYNEKNNKIFKILEQLIQSYELIKDNKSNILNLLNNCEIKENPKNNYFQQYKDLENLLKNIESSYYPSKKIKNLIELDNDLCAYCSEMCNNISIIDFKRPKMEIFTFKAHNKFIEYIIKANTDNIISYGNDKLINVWPLIGRKYLNEIKEKYLNKEDNQQNNFKEKEIVIYLNPIFTYNLEKEEKLIKMINLKENKFLMSFQNKSFLLFKYDFNKIELIQKNELKYPNISYLLDTFIIYKENTMIIAFNSISNMYFFELDNFTFIKSLPCKMKNSLIQINSREILIADGYHFNLIDINNFNIKLTVENSDKKLFLLNLDDGTFLFSTGDEVKRYFIKTIEELPILTQNHYDDNYDDELDFNNYNDDMIYYIYKLNSGKIINFYNNGRFTLGYLKFN